MIWNVFLINTNTSKNTQGCFYIVLLSLRSKCAMLLNLCFSVIYIVEIAEKIMTLNCFSERRLMKIKNLFGGFLYNSSIIVS